MKNETEQSPSHPPEVPEEELAHYDDRIIGRAFRWSAILFVILLIVGAVTYYWATHRVIPRAVQVTQIQTPIAKEVAVAEIPESGFRDITAESGVTFTHYNGAYGEKLLPETMGGGVAFFDYDNDGFPDILLANSAPWPWHPSNGSPPTMKLFHNEGSGKFRDTTFGSGLDVTFYGMGVAIGDYDNDGFVDVFISAVGKNHLFRNLGAGKFKEVTDEAGVGGTSGQWSTSSTWIDYDNDGDLDLFVCNYVRWSKEIDLEVGYKLVGVGRAYGQPMNFEGAFPYLYRNEGNGHFIDVSDSAGIQVKNPATGVPAAKSLGVAPVDLDGDGWIDLVVANDTVQNFVFHNQRNGTFKELGALSGIAFDSNGQTRGAMGIDAGYFRNDASLGIAIGNFANEMTALYVAQAKTGGLSPIPLFTDEAITEGVGPASRLLLKFGVFFFDYDLDGRLDLLTSNGHLEEEITKIQQSQRYAQPAQLFWNAGPNAPGCFQPVPESKCGSDLFKKIVGRGSAFADIDGDGDLDVILTQIAGAPLFLRNDQKLGHHWVKLKLVGTKSNRDALGAIIKARMGTETLSRTVMPTRSYLSQSELPVTIGLGSHDHLDELEVVWPGGKTQKVAASQLRLDAQNVITEDQ